ncbi:DUF72 domain-containing protein [Rhizobium leguminosarum]|uniref:DUF72 domain-containing protein n=1 Tax=Rhizobium TaxID=379 RepID=UPI00138A3C91|nr:MULTISPECIES: DUF72 domain-containing protein [Rhizobium]MBY5355574.1 DUF72 domain-containing protein [Rhizobium leguminosarum]NDK48478.1 DUF72 domain-containing protein [Rhizobium laguerreae]NNH43977.1 DUF72 domain-containing protein [Rhizobium laguerreae]NNH57949.1 DUF72 domain-containing protein [Rhizobium laguerreae]
MTKKTATVRIGVSGWTYAPWRGQFYPKDLPQKQELSYAARHFRSIEINGTFYGLQRPESFGRWREETPDDFVFAIKGPRFITHMLRLQDIQTALANFLASGVLRLGPKLGPILWQFPPNMVFDPSLFESFLSLLPHTRDAAIALARRHDWHIKAPAWLTCDGHQPIRHALEIRHESFRAPAFIEMLRRHKVALVCADTVQWPLLMDITADFIYCRLHGSEKLYVSGYEDEALDMWAQRIRAWATGGEPENATRVLAPVPARNKGRDVYLYFDNTDVKLRAPVDADHLSERLADLMPGSAPKAA